MKKGDTNVLVLRLLKALLYKQRQHSTTFICLPDPHPTYAAQQRCVWVWEIKQYLFPLVSLPR
jgi:hypothetical protein